MFRRSRTRWALVLCVNALGAAVALGYTARHVGPATPLEYLTVVWPSLFVLLGAGYLLWFREHPSAGTLYRGAAQGSLALAAFAAVLAGGIVVGQRVQGIPFPMPSVVVLQAAVGGSLPGLLAGHVHAQRRLAQRRAVAREQRLEVLSRVLRHDMRNKLGVALGAVETLDADESGETSRRVEMAREALHELQSTAETARAAEKTIGTRPFEQDLKNAVHGAVERACEEYGTAAVCDGDVVQASTDSVPVMSIPELDLAIHSVVSNAVEHGEPPVDVRVTTDETAGVGVVRVRDHGEGIPSAELEPLLRGEETALSHTSGVGLWLARWVADQSGGELRFSPDDSRTVVDIRLPLAARTRRSPLVRLRQRVGALVNHSPPRTSGGWPPVADD